MAKSFLKASKLLFFVGSLLRNPFFYWIFTSMLEHLPFVLPLRYLRETANLLAFFHPNPAHPFHVLLVPKRAIRSLEDLEPASPFLVDLVSAAKSLVSEYHLPAYRLVVNGGGYQEFPHLHFHLVSDAAQPENNN